MEKNSGNLNIQKAMELANSPTGQQLLSLLRSSDPEKLEQATQNAESGDYSGALDALQGFLSDPQARALLKQLGG